MLVCGKSDFVNRKRSESGFILNLGSRHLLTRGKDSVVPQRGHDKGKRSDNPCWPERSVVINTRSARRFVVCAHRTQRQASRFHGLTERLPTRAAWRPKSQQNAKALRSFRDAVNDIREILESRPEVALSTEYIRNAGRKVSVELRKLLLDGAPLVHRVLQGPKFQPLHKHRRSPTGPASRAPHRAQGAPDAPPERNHAAKAATAMPDPHPNRERSCSCTLTNHIIADASSQILILRQAASRDNAVPTCGMLGEGGAFSTCGTS